MHSSLLFNTLLSVKRACLSETHSGHNNGVKQPQHIWLTLYWRDMKRFILKHTANVFVYFIQEQQSNKCLSHQQIQKIHLFLFGRCWYCFYAEENQGSMLHYSVFVTQLTVLIKLDLYPTPLNIAFRKHVIWLWPFYYLTAFWLIALKKQSLALLKRSVSEKNIISAWTQSQICSRIYLA